MERVAEREAKLMAEQRAQRSSAPPEAALGYSAPPPPERKSSYDAYKGNLSSAAAGLYDGQNTSRTIGLRAPQQPVPQQPPPVPQQPPPPMQLQQQYPLDDSLNMTPKKSVTFHSDLATEIHYQRRFTESLSSDASYPQQSPNTPQSPLSFPQTQQQHSLQQQQQLINNAMQTPDNNHLPTSQQQPYAVASNQQQLRTPDNNMQPQFVTGDTPGVVGAQEVYRDPRERMLAAKQHNGGMMAPYSADRMSFRDKMRMFASEIGETTPEDRTKTSRAQQRIEAQLQTP